jgi:hypothetical protein
VNAERRNGMMPGPKIRDLTEEFRHQDGAAAVRASELMWCGTLRDGFRRAQLHSDRDRPRAMGTRNANRDRIEHGISCHQNSHVIARTRLDSLLGAVLAFGTHTRNEHQGHR